jgi:hypothetical protein
MGEAKRRGTFEQRKAQAIEAGRLKWEHVRKVLFRDFTDVFSPPEKPNRDLVLVGGAPVHKAIRNIVHVNIKQPGPSRKEHKPLAVIGQ